MAIKVYQPAPGIIAHEVGYTFHDKPEIHMDELRKRLYDAGLGKYTPSKRSVMDALRCAFAKIEDESKVFTGKDKSDRSYTKLVVKALSRREDDPTQRWSIHRERFDKHGQKHGYDDLGNASYDPESGDLDVPDGVVPCGPGEGSMDALVEMVQHFIEYADDSKLRGVVMEILNGIAKLKLPWKGVVLVGPGMKEVIVEKIMPVFAGMAQGEVEMILIELADTPHNKVTLQKNVTRSVNDELKALLGMVAEAGEKDEALTPSTMAEWVRQIENLKENLGLMGMLDVHLDYDVADVEAKINAMKEKVKDGRANGNGVAKKKTRTIDLED